MENDLRDIHENHKFRHQLPGGRVVIPDNARHSCIQMARVYGASDRLFRR